MKIIKMTMPRVVFILQNIMGLKVCDISLEIAGPDEIKITFHMAGETKLHYVNIKGDGMISYLIPLDEKTASGRTHEYHAINCLPITDYLIAEGYKFVYEAPRK